MVTSMVDEATQRAAACGAFAGATVSQCAVPKLNMEFSSRAGGSCDEGWVCLSSSAHHAQRSRWVR
jgi:hypothetical protein